MPQIRVKSGTSKGKIHPLTGDSLKLGRDSTCLIQLLDSGVSREHAEIYRVGEMYFIRDLGSRNGTTVNDLAVEDELLRDGDVIRISNCALVFEGSHGPAPAEPTSPEEESFFQEDSDPTATLTIRVSSPVGTSRLSEKFGMALTRLRKISSEATELPAAFEECLDILFQAMEIQEAFIFAVDARNTLHLKGYRADKAVKKKGKASRSIVQRALKERRNVLTANALEDFRFKSESSIIMKNVTSVLCSPLIAHGREYGVIYLSNGPEKTPFTEENSEFASLVSHQLALLYAAADGFTRLRETQQGFVALLEHAVESLTPELSGRGERVAGYVKALGGELGVKGRALAALVMAGHLHHIGYLEMHQGDPVTREFLESDRSYVERTVDLLSSNACFSDVVDIVRLHRARLDGKGLPGEIPASGWSLESQILALSVELDLQANLPIVFNEADKPLSDIVAGLISDGRGIVGANVLRAFEDAYKNGLILAD